MEPPATDLGRVSACFVFGDRQQIATDCGLPFDNLRDVLGGRSKQDFGRGFGSFGPSLPLKRISQFALEQSVKKAMYPIICAPGKRDEYWHRAQVPQGGGETGGGGAE